MTTPPLDLPTLKARVESIPPNGESAMKGMAFPATALPELWTLRHIARVDAPALLARVDALEASTDRARVEVMAGEHAETCARRYAWAPDNCTCWKNAMLAALGWSNQ